MAERKYFNCTIQELKHASVSDNWRKSGNFNCTIQELKQVLRTKYEIERQAFQLHHTGIKTSFYLADSL